ncbi:MAG TPA: flagellar motor protein MotD [Steroidobacteraceae bacterium]|nr:flagellar motor protein MotD [Steroidobacteraceae bacterium]
MARRHKHEEHQNHEAWAIPYGDLITLLLAFFVVMYAVSSVNEGKYRVLSDSLAAAFRGPPRSTEPVQLETKAAGRGGRSEYPGTMPHSLYQTRESGAGAVAELPGAIGEKGGQHTGELALQRIARQVEDALSELVAQDMVNVRAHRQWVEIEIRTDILFASGDARVSEKAVTILTRVAGILAGLPNPLRVEGHTDNVPIRTAAYPSNWELSAARAASVVHLFMNLGIEPQRMEISGFGEYRPRADNATAAGRDQNRRVLVIVLDPALREPGTTPRAGGVEAAAPVAAVAPAPAPMPAAPGSAVR